MLLWTSSRKVRLGPGLPSLLCDRSHDRCCCCCRPQPLCMGTERPAGTARTLPRPWNYCAGVLWTMPASIARASIGSGPLERMLVGWLLPARHAHGLCMLWSTDCAVSEHDGLGWCADGRLGTIQSGQRCSPGLNLGKAASWQNPRLGRMSTTAASLLKRWGSCSHHLLMLQASLLGYPIFRVPAQGPS